MRQPKYSIKVHPIEEKDFYRVMKELEEYGRSMFDFPNREKQQGLARKIGVRGKLLIEAKRLYPPARTRNQKQNIVAIPPNIIIREKKKGLFEFLRKKNIS